jgi:ABC-2 type transport system permease protein
MLSLRAGAFARTAQLAAASYVGDSPLFLLDYLLRIVRVVVLLALWRSILGTPTGERALAEAGLSLAAVLTYTVVSEAFSQQLEVRTELDVELWDGAVVVRFLRPASLVGQLAAELLGRWAFGLVGFAIPLFLVAPLLGVDPLPASPVAGALFVASLVLGTTVGLALDFIFAILMAALQISVWVVHSVRTAVGTVLSGALIPLALLPGGLGELFGYLPFAATASAPLRIYTASGPPALLLLSQVSWAVCLWLIAGRLWSANRERLVGYGG